MPAEQVLTVPSSARYFEAFALKRGALTSLRLRIAAPCSAKKTNDYYSQRRRNLQCALALTLVLSLGDSEACLLHHGCDDGATDPCRVVPFRGSNDTHFAGAR